MKKTARKHFKSGGEVSEGKNVNIGEDTRARALAWLAGEKTPTPRAKTPSARRKTETIAATDTGDETSRLSRRASRPPDVMVVRTQEDREIPSMEPSQYREPSLYERFKNAWPGEGPMSSLPAVGALAAPRMARDLGTAAGRMTRAGVEGLRAGRDEANPAAALARRYAEIARLEEEFGKRSMGQIASKRPSGNAARGEDLREAHELLEFKKGGKVMNAKFKREPKEYTTEPSVDELKHEGMKRGGKAHKHMADGGLPILSTRRPMGSVPVVRRPAAAVARPGAPTRPAMAAPMVMRKKGGKAEGGETRAEHKAEMREMKKLEHEMKSHEKKPAHLGHKGLKAGGLLPGFTTHERAGTGGIEGPGYCVGGKMRKAKGGGVKAYEQTKMHEATKHGGGKRTGDVEEKFKRGGATKHHYATGGAVHGFAQTKMHEASKHHEKLGTKGIEGAGYKAGGHAAHHTTMSKHSYGHTTMKKGGKC